MLRGEHGAGIGRGVGRGNFVLGAEPDEFGEQFLPFTGECFRNLSRNAGKYRHALGQQEQRIGDESAAIELAYKARSGYVHHASEFAGISLAWTTLGVSPDVFFAVIIGEEMAPSILWLERIIAHAITTYVTGQKKLVSDEDGHTGKNLSRIRSI